MSYLDRVDAEYVKKLMALRVIEHEHAHQSSEEHVELLDRAFKHKTMSERRCIADKLSQMNYSAKYRELIKDEITLLRATNALIALGYNELGKELGAFAERYHFRIDSSDTYIDYIINGAIKKHRSDSVSGPRHHLHDEIVAVMKATWKKEPALSRTKMIAKLSRRYEGRISEETIKYWIKSEKLAPPPPPGKKYKDAKLVIPPEYA
ncbi:conserved hypothetical protein [Escherichia coli]|nr:hypothetical protein [Escherichia coli]VEW03700.1 conserved hypothetical protein [Escherichia coli]